MLSNLITNSVVDGFEVKSNNKINILVEKENNQILISYKDNGKGMNEEQLKNSMSPFIPPKWAHVAVAWVCISFIILLPSDSKGILIVAVSWDRA